MNEKRGHATSEPEDFLRLAERMNSWGLMVALIGEGQEIHLGEESGLPQWNAALAKMQNPWIVHCPEKIAGTFTAAKKLATTHVLDLSVSLRSHLAEDVAQWIAAMLEGDLIHAKILSERVTSQGFDVYLTQDINVATNYVKERYKGQEDKRYGLLASSKAKNLPNWGIHNEYNYTKNMREGPWYSDPRARLTHAVRSVMLQRSSRVRGLNWISQSSVGEMISRDRGMEESPGQTFEGKGPAPVACESAMGVVDPGPGWFHCVCATGDRDAEYV